MKKIELLIVDGENPINAISLVEEPAIESDFIYLSKEYKIELKTANEEKKLVVGPALIPDKMIYRRDGADEFEVFFSKDTVRQASQLYLKNHKQGSTTLDHAVPVSNITVVESWIVEDTEKDKSAFYGLSVPVGTWMVAMKIDNKDIWNDFIKTGEVKGFSIEGSFIDKLLKAQTQKKPINEELIDLLNEL